MHLMKHLNKSWPTVDHDGHGRLYGREWAQVAMARALEMAAGSLHAKLEGIVDENGDWSMAEAQRFADNLHDALARNYPQYFEVDDHVG